MVRRGEGTAKLLVLDHNVKGGAKLNRTPPPAPLLSCIALTEYSITFSGPCVGHLCGTTGPGGDRAVDQDQEHDGDGRVGHPGRLDGMAARHGALLAQLRQLQVVVGLQAGVVGPHQVVVVPAPEVLLGGVSGD
jgi:hypothetical protein